MKKKTHFFKNVFWVAREIFNYDKKYIYILLISVVISGILPPISTLLSQEVVNALQKKMHIKPVIRHLKFVKNMDYSIIKQDFLMDLIYILILKFLKKHRS